jgi:hypothetical protein
VFVDKVEQHIFKPRGEPVRRSEKSEKAVKDVLCPNCGKFRQLCNSCDIKVVASFPLYFLTAEGLVFCRILLIRNHGNEFTALQSEYTFEVFRIFIAQNN